MFEITEFKGALKFPENPEYMVRFKPTKRVMGFGDLEECKVMCSALNNRYYPKIVFNSPMKILLQNED